MKPASALAIALAAAAVLPATAGAASQTTTYKVVKATGSQRVEYTANGDSCSRFGTCGFGGTITYKFTGTPKGHLVMKQSGNGHITGAANFTSKGTTVSDVTSGGAMAQVKVRVAGGELTSAITRDAVAELGLAVGSEVVALVKSTEVSLSNA